jgi:hypothetical protein
VSVSAAGERHETWVVDRIEGRTAVLVCDETERQAQVSLKDLPHASGEGNILRVPVSSDGSPDWTHATIDHELERARLEELKGRISNLRKRDPGGDISL